MKAKIVVKTMSHGKHRSHRSKDAALIVSDFQNCSIGTELDFSGTMFGHFRPNQQSLALQGSQVVSSSLPIRAPASRVAVGLGTSSISVVFIFNLDTRVDSIGINEIINKACYASVSSEDAPSSQVISGLHQQPFIQFRRVPGEAFGIALFRSAAGAARAARALTGVQMFGKVLYAQMDKRTQQLVEQWKFLRSKELGAKIAAQGYEIPSNIMELVNNELSEQVNKAKGLVVESAALHELRITRFQGLDEIHSLLKVEEDRIQDVLVRKAEEAGKVDKTNAELRALITQLREQERLSESIDREAERRESESKNKRKFEMKTKSLSGNPSVFELRQLVPSDRDALFSSPIDWEGIFNSSRSGGSKSSVILSLTPWLVRKVKDFIGSYDRELVEYIIRRVRLRTDPTELITDLRQYIDDEADELVKQIWSILVFETARRQHSPSTPIDPGYFVKFVLAGTPPSAAESYVPTP